MYERGKGVKKAKWNGVAEKKKKGRKKREGRGGGDGSGFTIKPQKRAELLFVSNNNKVYRAQRLF